MEALNSQYFKMKFRNELDLEASYFLLCGDLRRMPNVKHVLAGNDSSVHDIPTTLPCFLVAIVGNQVFEPCGVVPGYDYVLSISDDRVSLKFEWVGEAEYFEKTEQNEVAEPDIRFSTWTSYFTSFSNGCATNCTLNVNSAEGTIAYNVPPNNYVPLILPFSDATILVNDVFYFHPLPGFIFELKDNSELLGGIELNHKRVDCLLFDIDKCKVF